MDYPRAMVNLVPWLTIAAMFLLGCGGAHEESLHVHYEPVPSVSESAPGVEAPQETVREIKTCIEARTGQWAEPSYAFQYDVTADQQGTVLDLRLRDATLRDASLETCFEQALAAMSVPKDALRLRSSKPVSGGESTYSSRGNVGIVQAAAAPIALAPIIVPALGATIIVAISLGIIRKATSDDPERERCRKVNEACQQKCLPKLKHSDFGNLFHRCMRECREAQGCW